jgi:DNA/RNA endonuclease YhcR with UshA esterase domain
MRLVFLAGFLFTAPLLAADAPATPAPAPATKPATAPSKLIDIVAEKDKLKELIGQDVTMRGKVVEVFVSNRSGITILNFFPAAERRLFNAVIDKANLDAINAANGGDVGAAVKDQTVLITGTVSDYRGSPQIKIEKPEQLKVEPAAKEEKKPE